jgi:hypothetical protein
MAFLNDLVFDNGLSVLTAGGTRVDICKNEPTTYALATGGDSVGNKTAAVVGAPAARTPNGRKVTVAAITNGTVTATSTGATDDAQYWAITDPANSRLLATGALAAAQLVTSGNTFTLAAFDIGFPAAV